MGVGGTRVIVNVGWGEATRIVGLAVAVRGTGVADIAGVTAVADVEIVGWPGSGVSDTVVQPIRTNTMQQARMIPRVLEDMTLSPALKEKAAKARPVRPATGSRRPSAAQNGSG